MAVLEDKENLLWQLGWHQPEDVQKAAMEAIVSDTAFDPALLLMPVSKACWENAAICLKRIGYPKSKQVLDGMLEWLKDLNWPGADVILSLLESYPKEAFRCGYEKAVERAVKDKDEDWLNGLFHFAAKQKVLREDFSDPGLYDALVRRREKITGK